MSASLILMVSVCLYLAMGVPVAFALGLSTVTALGLSGNFPMLVVLKETFTGIDSFPLMAVPFFMLAGEIMNAGGLSRRIVNFAMALVGHVRGGLGYVAIVAAVMVYFVSSYRERDGDAGRENAGSKVP